MASPERPALLAVDDDPLVLRAIRRDLSHAYADRYRVLAAASGADALLLLDELKRRGAEPALLLSDQRMPGMTGTEFLAATIGPYPAARRVLLTAYADTDAAIAAINQAHLDYYLLKPWEPPTERLYPVLDELLADWPGSYRPR
jgi:thioredoxin reductase (NADPH)